MSLPISISRSKIPNLNWTSNERRDLERVLMAYDSGANAFHIGNWHDKFVQCSSR